MPNYVRPKKNDEYDSCQPSDVNNAASSSDKGPSTPSDVGAVTTIPSNQLVDAVRWGAMHVAAGLNSVFGDRSTDSFGILMYHRVAEEPSGVPSPTINVTPATLRSQLQGLLDRGFKPWHLRRLVDARNSNEKIPENVFAVTFDDGFANNYLDALPILEELGVPATIFVATAYLDSERPFPFDNWSHAGSSRVAERSWRPLTTAECRKLGEHELIQLGAHTHTHGAFLRYIDELCDDLAVNLAVLRERFGVTRPVFAFPFGVFSADMVDAVREMDLAGAVTTRPNRICRGGDPFYMGRFCADEWDTTATLAAKLGGWYSPVVRVLRAIKRPIAALTPGGIGEPITLSQPCYASNHDTKS